MAARYVCRTCGWRRSFRAKPSDDMFALVALVRAAHAEANPECSEQRFDLED